MAGAGQSHPIPPSSLPAVAWDGRRAEPKIENAQTEQFKRLGWRKRCTHNTHTHVLVINEHGSSGRRRVKPFDGHRNSQPPIRPPQIPS
uniref:Uncharacterized protein n=1 Tax=Globodera rostochiensis TaxID=31243 RepID=A0A914HVH6_GLORO